MNDNLTILMNDFEQTYKTIEQHDLISKLLNILFVKEEKKYLNNKIKYVNKHTNDDHITSSEKIMNENKLCLETKLPDGLCYIAILILRGLIDNVCYINKDSINQMKLEKCGNENCSFNELINKYEEHRTDDYYEINKFSADIDNKIKIKNNRWINDPYIKKHYMHVELIDIVTIFDLIEWNRIIESY